MEPFGVQNLLHDGHLTTKFLYNCVLLVQFLGIALGRAGQLVQPFLTFFFKKILQFYHSFFQFVFLRLQGVEIRGICTPLGVFFPGLWLFPGVVPSQGFFKVASVLSRSRYPQVLLQDLARRSVNREVLFAHFSQLF